MNASRLPSAADVYAPGNDRWRRTVRKGDDLAGPGLSAGHVNEAVDEKVADRIVPATLPVEGFAPVPEHHVMSFGQ